MSLLSILKPLGTAIAYLRFNHDRMRLKNLIRKGLKVGKNAYIELGFGCDPVYPYLVEIGDNCRIARDVKILAHDATIFRELGVNRIAPVKILDGCFIGERAIILPGVTIGPNAMIAAGSLVNRNIGEGKVAAGNPARPYANFADMLEKYRNIVPGTKVFSKKDIENGLVSSQDIISHLKKNPVAFVQGVPKKDPCYINENMDEIRKSAIKAYEELIRFV